MPQPTARDRARIRRQQARQIQVDRATTADKRPLTGVVLGFDADAAAYRIQIPGGGVIRAASLSNGAIATGSSVRVNTARGSVLATVDSMPR